MSIAACADIVRRGDPDRFLATMAAPVSARKVLFPIYAFNVEVARAPWVTQEPMIAEMRLQWWRDVVGEIASGGPVRSHEVATPLADVLDADSAALLDQLIEARRWDVYKDPFEDEDHFQRYIDDTAAGLSVCVARALNTPNSEIGVRDIAWAAGLAAWFLAVPKLEDAGRIPMVDGRPEAVKALADKGLERLKRANVTAEARIATLACWRARPLLRQVSADPTCVVEGRLSQSEFARKAGLMIRSFGLRG